MGVGVTRIKLKRFLIKNNGFVIIANLVVVMT